MRRPLRDWSALAVAFMAGGALMSVVSATAQDPPPTVAPLVGDVDVPVQQQRTLVLEQVKLAERVLGEIADYDRKFDHSREALDRELRWAHRLAEAKLTLACSAAERAEAIQPYVDRLDSWQKEVDAFVEARLLSASDRDNLRYKLLEARLWLLREQGK